MVKRTRLDQQLVLAVQRTPLVGMLGTAALPRLEVDRRPDDVDDAEQHETVVVSQLQRDKRVCVAINQLQHNDKT